MPTRRSFGISVKTRLIDRSQAAWRERRDVGPAIAEVDAGAGLLRPGGRLGRRRRGLGDLRRAARAGEVALGDELLVGLDDDAARETLGGGECARRWEDGAGAEATAADAIAEGVLELSMERRGAIAVQVQQQLGVGTGPQFRHRTGPYQRTGHPPSW